MSCHICQAEAVTRCFTCGGLVCAEHATGETCPRCSGGFTAADPRAVSAQPLGKDQHHGWWRPQEADEYLPPACYQCQGLSRGLCRNCQSSYCRDHAGPSGLCQACGRSANLGIYLIVSVFGLMALLLFCNWLFN